SHQHRVQLLQLRGGRDLVPDPHHPAGPLHRPADRAGPRTPPGRRNAVSVITGSGARALHIDNVSKAFGENLVLTGITQSVMNNEVVCLIGASGSGKSTLLRCVNLLERVDQGAIYLDGSLITGPNVNQNLVRKHIGIVFQSYNLFPHMTVERNITLAPVKVLGLSRAEAVARATELLERFGLAE